MRVSSGDGRRRRWRLVLPMLAVALLAGGGAGRASTDAVRAAKDTAALPTWENLYDWPGGHGYAGWHTSTSSTADYGLAPALGGRYGVWLWPKGGQHVYTPGDYAEWTYTAPGTTRLARTSLSFSYRNKLLAHHCIEIGFRTLAGVTTTSEVYCQPVHPPESQDLTNVSLEDPSQNPTSKVLYIRIRVDCGGASTCAKTIPALDPLSTGAYLRVRMVDMTLVDDDSPIVEAANTFHDSLDYANGSASYPLTVYAHDPGSGVTRAWAETTADGGQIVSSDAPCDPTHNTAELDNRICPEYYSFTANVDTSPIPEGQIEFAAKGADLAATTGLSDPWRLYVDRGAPQAAANFVVSNYDTDTSSATVAWDEGDDPDLPDGSPGSGVAGSQYRYQVAGGGWTDWTQAGDASFDVAAQPGDTIDVQVDQADLVGNHDGGTAGTVTVSGTEVDQQLSPLADTEQVESDETPQEPPDDFGLQTQSVRLAGAAATACGNVSVANNNSPGLRGWTFTNCDGAWTIYRTCYDSGLKTDSDKRIYRQVVGPGYVAFVRRSPSNGGGVIVNDLARMYADTVSSFGDPTGAHGYMGAVWGGLGEFGIHYARGNADQLPNGWDPTWPATFHPTTYMLEHMRPGARGHLPLGNTLTDSERNSIGTRDPRRIGTLEERMCPAANSGYGVKGVQYHQWEQGNDQWLRITVTLGDPAQPVVRIRRTYDFSATNVRVWAAVTELATANANGTPFVKEPKFGVALRGGQYTREVEFAHDPTKAAIGAAPNIKQTAGEVQSPTAVLKTKEVGGADHERVEWDYGTSNCNSCMNVVMRGYPVDHRTSVSPGLTSLPWRNSGVGLDKWAAVSGDRTTSYANDTYGDDGVLSACANVTARDVGDLNHNGGVGDDADKAIYSRDVTPAASGARQWELSGGWVPAETPHTGDQLIDPVPYYVATGALFHGWEGNRGPYDCEEKQVAFGPAGETFGTFESFSVGAGWTRR